MPSGPDQPSRYHRQELLPQIGSGGQRQLTAARVIVVGCGALGSVIADQLVRAGVGHLRLVDRDIVELTNLQRQVLFDESDAEGGLPKAVAAAARLHQINSAVQLEPLVVDMHGGNVEQLLGIAPGRSEDSPVDLILDGTDNVETRYLLNDAAVKHAIPWIHGACIGAEGRVMAILPGDGPCLRCLYPDPPRAADLPTCDTAGVLGPVASMVASLQALAAIKLLSGNATALGKLLWKLDLWNSRVRTIDLSDARNPGCPPCAQRRFDFLDSVSAGPAGTTTLCGRNTIQLRPAGSVDLSLPLVAERLGKVAQVQLLPYFVRGVVDGIRLTVFPDGRLLAEGTTDQARVRSLYARYVGA